MRNFVISVLCLSFIVGAWLTFDWYSNHKLHTYTSTIDHQIINSLEHGNWRAAYDQFLLLSDDWHQYKKYAAFFLDTNAINEADYTIAKAKYYIKAKDNSNAPGELSCLKEQLTFLHDNESLSIGNVF